MNIYILRERERGEGGGAWKLSLDYIECAKSLHTFYFSNETYT